MSEEEDRLKSESKPEEPAATSKRTRRPKPAEEATPPAGSAVSPAEVVIPQGAAPLPPPPVQQKPPSAYEPTQPVPQEHGRRMPKVSAPKVNMPKVAMPSFQLAVNTGEINRRAQAGLARTGIDTTLAPRILLLALVSGLVAGLFSLLSSEHVLLFGGLVAAMNGIAYGILKRNPDLAGLLVSMIAGMTAMLFWYVMTGIVDRLEGAHLNLFQALFVGLTFGALGFSWVALLEYLRGRFMPTAG